MKLLLPVTVYYIRRLLRTSQAQLKSVVAEGACLVADPEIDLNAVIESLYLDDEDIAEQINELEKLVLSHQVLVQAKQPDQIKKVEDQIFWILGLKRTAKAAQEVMSTTPMMAFSY